MTILTTHSTTLEQLEPAKSRNPGSIKIAQSMSSRHICPCCSHPLLRHTCRGKLYWRCNHCYQAMPVIEDAQELPLFVTHGTVISAIVDSQKSPIGMGKRVVSDLFLS